MSAPALSITPASIAVTARVDIAVQFGKLAAARLVSPAGTSPANVTQRACNASETAVAGVSVKTIGRNVASWKADQNPELIMKKLIIVMLLLFVAAPLATGVAVIVGGCKAEVGDPD